MPEQDLPQRGTGLRPVEIVVIVGIAALILSMLVVTKQGVHKTSYGMRARDNVKSLATMLIATKETTGRWPPYSGKNFILSLVASGQIDPRNIQNLEVLFSPGDATFSVEMIDLDRYGDVTPRALRAGYDFHELTSYAGRRNADPEFRLTLAEEKAGAILLCDDDDGPLHHPAGLVVGYANGVVRFIEWDEFDMLPPEDPDYPDPFLGDDAANEQLLKVSSN